MTGDFRVSLVSSSTLPFASSFVEQRPAERREKKDRIRPAMAFKTRGRGRICAAEQKKNPNPIQYTILKTARGLGENETRLCKCLKNVLD